MLRERLSRSGIETQIYYSRPLSQQPALKGRCRIPEPTRQAHGFCQEALALPCHEGMTDDQLQVVLDALEVCW